MRLRIHGTHRRSSIRAMTLLEVLVVLFILLLLAGFLLARLAPSKGHGNARILCVNNLKNLGFALRMFAFDNEDRFPWMVPIEKGGSLEELADDSRIWRHFQVISNELTTPMILRCRNDTNSPSNGAYAFISPGAEKEPPRRCPIGAEHRQTVAHGREPWVEARNGL